MTQAIVTELEQSVLTLRMNRPEKKNAITTAMYNGISQALDRAADDAAVRVVLLTGGPDCFSSGNDIVDFLDNPPGDMADSPVGRFMAALSQFRKPVVAAVNGLAIGIGTTMLLHCDLVYAGTGARFQMPFASIGVCPEFGSSYVLPRLLGHQRAAELLMLGEPLDAARALDYGLINGVLPDARVSGHALAQARRLAQQPPNALRTTKALLKRWTQAQMAEVIRVEAQHFQPLLNMPEAREAMNAFRQKRKPDFSQFS